MKTAISLPDDLFKRADALARRLKRSRSQVYRDAMAEYLLRHDEDEITAALNRVADNIDTALDEFGKEVARRTFDTVEW